MGNGFSGRMHKGKSIFFLGLLIATATSFAVPGKATQPTRHDRVPGQLIVKLRDQGMALQTLHFSLAHLGLLSVKPFVTNPALKVITLKDDAAVDGAIQMLGNEPSVEYA